MSTEDSDSGDSRNRGGRPPPPPPWGPNPPKPKKKKRTLPPQETINKIWSKFSAPKFSKAITILPFAPEASTDPSNIVHASKATPNNLLVSEDFERAVIECRTKVQKLVKECKRVNMRYRDPTFDLDSDLKWERGYCLNGLVHTKFEINARAFSNPTANVPKAVKRVHEIFEKPTFLKENVAPADIKQGILGDCWLMASLTALANMQVGLQRLCVEYNTKIGIYGFVFHRDGEWIISIIDDKLYLKSPDWDSPSVQRHLLEQIDKEDVEKEYRRTYQTGSQALFFAHCRDQNETWLPLLQKAYAKAHGDYAALAGGWIGEGVEDLTGGVTTELLTSDILDTDEFWNNEILKVNKEFLFGCSTGILDGGYGNRNGITECHAYVIMEARELSTGERLIKLRNPWGKGKKGNWEGPWSDGSKEFTPEAQRELNHKFGNDSVFWISFEDLLRKYQHFDRTRLFMDSPDWRVTQKWISVEVPWKAKFEQKFRIVLTKESPVLLVLSQLDDRYFQGLTGQYTFRLQFRLHDVNSPEEEEYIVRSHGNYLMERSVVTELKSLGPGTYSVFVQVAADRDCDLRSVEDVVKSQCRHREDNDKLAQVGAMYDLAHSKGAAHLEAKSKARIAKEKAKARQARIAARRKGWEKDHLSRELRRKQEAKNQEKRKTKKAKEAAEAKTKQCDEKRDAAVQTDEMRLNVAEGEMANDQIEQSPDEVKREVSSPPSDKQPCIHASKPEQTDNKSVSSIATPNTPSRSSSIPSPLPSRIQHASTWPIPPPTQPGQRSRNERRESRHAGPGPEPEISRQRYYISEGDSSASPISDIEDLWDDDEPAPKPEPSPNPHYGPPRHSSGRKSRDSEDDDEPDPWNAICIVGLRVYSKDEGLEVKIFEEGMEDDAGTDGDDEDENSPADDCDNVSQVSSRENRRQGLSRL